MDKSDAASVIKKLIETCKDGEEGYRNAAEHAKSSELQSFFREQSSERGRFAQELQAQLSKVGEAGEKESGSVSAALHRAWIDTKAALGGGDHTILESVEQGEDAAKKAYEEAAHASLPADVAAIVSRQAERIRAGHDRARDLRDNHAA
ncbi:MAG: PA2169 family four-helix-bundle protein [Acidobacteriales bacterium]|nr:PA2169 family four-helix-bundle protein [Terriglobales bacterium]